MIKIPKFSVIIPTRKIDHFIYGAIPQHLSQNYKNFEIIILSEADESDKFEKTRIIRVPRVSPSEKRNIGVKHAKGEILAFIDDDAYPDKDWLKNAEKIFKDKNIVALGGTGLVPPNATFFQRVSSKVYALSSGFTGIRYEKGKRREIDDWPTCNFFIRKKDFLDAGGFDSKYWGGEDTQVCYSLLKTGKKMIYDPSVVVYHYPRETLSKHLKQTSFWGIWRGFFMRIHTKNSFKLVFIIPPLFILWLVVGGILSLLFKPISYLYLLSLILYVLFLLIIGIRTKSFRLFLPVIVTTALTHFIYGVGFIKGILFGEPIRKTFNPAEDKKIE